MRRGQMVKGGTPIGSVGSIVEENTEHTAELVFELWRDGVAVDPEPYIFGRGN